MSEVKLKDPAQFGQKLLSLYLEQGFQSLPKRDLELLIFFLLEIDGAIDRKDNNYIVARKLRVTPTRVKALRRDAYARWRPLIDESRKDALQRILESVLTVENIEAGTKHASEKSRKEGFIAVRIEHPDDQGEFEQAIMDVGAIPIYERNRDVLVVRFDTLIAISEKLGLLGQDSRRVRSELKELAPAAEELEDFLKKPIQKLTWAEARSVLNSVGAKAIAGLVDTKVTDVLKIVFPFLKKK
jgi:hypothetical protein